MARLIRIIVDPEQCEEILITGKVKVVVDDEFQIELFDTEVGFDRLKLIYPGAQIVHRFKPGKWIVLTKHPV